MPLHIDVHNMDGEVTYGAVREAHHREAHGLVADEIYEVQEGS
jgi:hypothetical protein